MGAFNWIFQNVGLPGLIGMGLGYWLFGTNVKGNGNILGEPPWSPFVSALAGGVVFGLAIWVLIGLILGFHGIPVNF